MIRLWGRISSINVRKVVWALQELGLTFERIDAGREHGVVTTPAFAARNPNQLVPLLDDGGFELWESNAIVRYLFAKYSDHAAAHGEGAAPAPYPLDLGQRFDAERWMDWQQTTLNPAGSPAFKQLYRTAPAQRRPELIDASQADMVPLLALLDAHLAQRDWVCGTAFGMADIPIACDIHRWWGLPLLRAEWPHIQRWFDRVMARPAVRGVLDIPLA